MLHYLRVSYMSLCVQLLNYSITIMCLCVYDVSVRICTDAATKSLQQV